MERYFLMIAALLLLAFPVWAQKAKPKPKRAKTPAPVLTPAPVEGYGPPKISEIPLPCMLKTTDIPALFGVRLDMPIDEAKALYTKVPQRKMDMGLSEMPPNFAAYSVPVKYLAKTDLGGPVASLEFSSIVEKKVESMAVRFTNVQPLASEALFGRLSKMLNMAPEVWLLVDHGGGLHLSWRAQCDGFQVQFDAQKGLYYRLWLSKDYAAPKPKTKTPPPIGDGE